MSIPLDSTFQITGELLPETISGPEKKTLHRRNAHPKNSRDLLVGHPLMTAEDYRHSFLLAE